MADFASPEWIDDLDRAARAVAIDPALDIVVEHRVSDGPTWHVVLHDGSVRIRPGAADAPTLTLTSSLAVARAIHTGEQSAQRAFLDGALRIGGDVTTLISRREAFAEVAALMAAT